MASLAEGILEQQKRCRELLGIYKEIGPGGMFGAAFIEKALDQTEKAVMEGDLVAMMQCYEELKGFE